VSGANEFRGELMLLPGTYEIKFLVDGQWRLAQVRPLQIRTQCTDSQIIALSMRHAFVLFFSPWLRRGLRGRAAVSDGDHLTPFLLRARSHCTTRREQSWPVTSGDALSANNLIQVE